MSLPSKIQSIEARTIRVPLDNPTSFSTRQVHHRDYAVVRVRTDDGAEGIGFCYGGSNAGSLVTHAVRELFAPLLIGEDALRVEGLWEKMYREGILQARSGAAMRALSIIDIALWDRNARSVNLPLHRFLGGYHEDSVPAYASGGYYLDGKTPEKLGEELAGYVELGFKAVKMKVGRLDPQGEEARIKAAREAIGPDVLLMLDANNAWSDLPTALRFMERYEPYAPYWIEEPFSPTTSTTMPGSLPAPPFRSRPGRSRRAAGASRSCSTRAPRASCRPTPPSAAASANTGASVRRRRATASTCARTGSTTCTCTWWAQRPTASSSSSSPTIRCSISAT